MRNRYEFQGGHHVNNEDEEDYEVQEIKSRNSIYSLSVFYAFGVLVCVLGLYGIAYGLNEILPTPIKISEEVGMNLKVGCISFKLGWFIF